MMLQYVSWALAYLYQSILLLAKFESIIFAGYTVSLANRSTPGQSMTIFSMNFSLKFAVKGEQRY